MKSASISGPFRDRPAINGVGFDLISPRSLITAVDAFVEGNSSSVVHFLAVDPTVRAQDDLAYRQELNEGHLNIADGQPITWALRLKGYGVTRITGTDAIGLLCTAGLANNHRHYLYGSSEPVTDLFTQRLRAQYPGIHIVGVENPPMGLPSGEHLAESAARIKTVKADLLWIGIGTPNQHHVAKEFRRLALHLSFFVSVRRLISSLERSPELLDGCSAAAWSGFIAYSTSLVASPRGTP